MPHLFTSRLRKDFLLSHLSSSKKFKFEFEKWNNRLYLFSSILFIIGSIFFLPSFSIYNTLGLKIFTIGLFISLALNLHDFYEVIQRYTDKKVFGFWNYLEISAVLLYLLGTINYLIGNYYFIFKPSDEWSAGFYFIVGSLIFTIAAIINLMLVTTEYSYHKLMLMNANAACNIIGSLLFVVGSIPYLWTNFSLNLDTLMAYQFIFGSIAFFIGSIFSQINTNIKIADYTASENTD